MTITSTILRALRQARGDDLERASAAFHGMSVAQMQEQHGQSDCTRQEIFDAYKTHATEIDAAIDWITNYVIIMEYGKTP